MAATDQAAPGIDQVHGLNYDPGFLDALPVLSPLSASPVSASPSRSSSAEPRQPSLPLIRGLTASQFAEMHLRYVTTHAPDSVIFPFLHGLEGDNDAQNAFFYSNGSMAAVNNTDATNKDHLKARAPRFRGLVWVASDEDEVEEYERALKARRQAHTTTSHHRTDVSGSVSIHSSRHPRDDLDDDLDDDIDEDDYSTSSLDDDEVDDDDFATAMRMDIDDHVDLSPGVVGMDVDIHGQHGESLLDHPEGSHMHPVVHAHRPTLSAIDTSPKGEFRYSPWLSPHSFFLRLSSCWRSGCIHNSWKPLHGWLARAYMPICAFLRFPSCSVHLSLECAMPSWKSESKAPPLFLTPSCLASKSRRVGPRVMHRTCVRLVPTSHTFHGIN
jgi:hypothetical protein